MTLESASAAVLHGLAITYALWVFYVLVMGFYRAKLQGRLSRVAFVLGFPMYAIGYLLDVFVQMTVASVLFLELPREGLVTARQRGTSSAATDGGVIWLGGFASIC